jgi:hypothetical protein
MKHHQLLLTILLSSVLFQWSCRKEVPLDDTDKDFPLSLSYTFDNNEITLNWEAKRTTGFQQWVIRRSTSPIPAGELPSINNAGELLRSNESLLNTFKDRAPLFDTAFFYRLYLQDNGRWLESNEINVSFNTFAQEGFLQGVFYHPRKPWALMFYNGSSGNIVVLFDLVQKKELSRFTRNDLYDFNSISIDFKEDNGEEKLYLVTSNNYFLSTSLPNMTQSPEIYLGLSTWSIVCFPERDWIVSTGYDYAYSVNIRMLNSPSSIISGFNSEFYYSFRTLHQMSTSNMSFIEAGTYQINRFRLNPDGTEEMSFRKTLNTTGASLNPFKQLAFSPDNSKFIMNVGGKIYDTELNVIKELPIPSNGNFTDIRFSNDGAFIYVVETTSIGTSKIYKFSYSDLTLLNTLSIESTSSVRLHPRNDGSVDVWVNSLGSPTKFTYTNVNL